MRKKITKLSAVLSAFKTAATLYFVLAVLQSCQKNDKVLPGKLDRSASTSSTLSAPSVSNLYEVNTFFQGYPALDNAFRLCKAADNTLYATSSGAKKVYKISNTAVVTDLATFADGSNLIGVKAGEQGSVYAAVWGENSIVKIDKNGHKTKVQVSIGLKNPYDVAIGPDSTLYIADSGNDRIVKVTKNGIASVLAGKTSVEGTADGQGQNARFVLISNIRYASDNTIWVLDADPSTHVSGKSLRKITLDGNVTTFYKVTKVGVQTGIVDFAPSKKDKNFDPTMKENFFLITLNFPDSGNTEYKISHLSADKVETTIVPYNTGEYKDGSADQAVIVGANGIAVAPNGIFLTDGGSSIRKISRKL
jgi:sugar lactone lactonase YvrE